MKGIMKGLQTASFRGSTKRADAIDESDNHWKGKAGRSDGPDTYMPGDYCASVLNRVYELSARERNALYGGPVVLIGVLEADGLLAMDTNGLSDPYVSIVALDGEGEEIEKEKAISRTIPETLEPQWDELYCFGQMADTADIATIRFKLKDYDTPVRSDRLGQVDIDLPSIRAHASGTTWDAWFDVERTADMEGEGPAGRLRLQFFYHGPLPDPVPLAVGVRAVSAHALLVADRSGFSDPYVIIRPISRKGQPTLDAKGKKVECKTSIKNQTLDPVWNEAFVFGDACLGETGVEGTEAWGWEGGQDIELSKAKTATVTGVQLAKAMGLEFLLYDSDFGKTDDPLGVVTVPFSSLFGDDDTVVCGTTLRNDKVYAVKWCKGVDKKAKLGTIRLDIVLRFPDNLIPDGWVEAVDPDSGSQYYWDIIKGKAQWHEPAAYRDADAIEEEDGDDSGDRAAHMPADKSHKPPRPSVTGPTLSLTSPTASSSSIASTEAEVETPVAEAEPEPKPKTKTAKVKAAPVPEPEEEEEEAPVKPVKVKEAKPAKVAKAEPAPAPAPSPAPAAKKKTDEDEDGGDDEAAPADTAAIEQYAAVSFGGKVKETVVAGGAEVDLSSLAGAGQSEREKIFFETMKKNAAQKKKTEQDALKSKLSSMTPEELVEWEKEQDAEKKRAARRDKMAGQLASSYGSSGARAALAARGGKAGRGRGRGGKA